MKILIIYVFFIKYSAVYMQLQFAVARKRFSFCEIFRTKMKINRVDWINRLSLLPQNYVSCV